MSFKDSLLGLVIISIWGFNFIVIAWGVEYMPPLMMGTGRFIFVALIGSLFIKRPDIPWRWMTLYAMTLCFGQFALLFSAMSFGMPAGLASLVLQSQALFTIVLSALLLKEKITANQIISMLFAGAGLALIGLSQQQSTMTVLGFSLTIAAAISWGLGNIVNRMINQRGYRADLGLVVWAAWPAIIPFAMASIYVEGIDAITHSLSIFGWQSFAVLMYLAVGASMLGYSLWSYLLAHYPAGQVAPLTLGVPIVGLLSAMLLLDEMLNEQQFIGIALVMFGLLFNALGNKLMRFMRKTRQRHEKA